MVLVLPGGKVSENEFELILAEVTAVGGGGGDEPFGEDFLTNRRLELDLLSKGYILAVATDDKFYIRRFQAIIDSHIFGLVRVIVGLGRNLAQIASDLEAEALRFPFLSIESHFRDATAMVKDRDTTAK